MTAELLTVLTLPLLTLAERCTLVTCQGHATNLPTTYCLNAHCLHGNNDTAKCTERQGDQPVAATHRTALEHIIETKDCKYGCELNETTVQIHCLDRAIGTWQMLALIVTISCSGLILVACVTTWYMRRSKVVTDVVMENMNVVLIKSDVERGKGRERNDNEKCLPTIHEHE